MVKGISRQVIVVHAPDPKLFDQAIFILREDALGREGVTEDALLKEADRILHSANPRKKQMRGLIQLLWAVMGAGIMGLLWLACNSL